MEKYKNNFGFSLIEVMVAIAIFSLGLLAVFSMQIYSIRSNTRAFDVTEASQFAFRSLEWELMPGTKDNTYKPKSPQAKFGDPQVTVSSSTLSNAEKVTVTVKWEGKSISLSRMRDN